MAPTPTSGVLVVEHEPEAPAGLLLDFLRARGFAHRVVSALDALPEPAGIDRAVILGSAASLVGEPPAWAAAELSWIREADRAGRPVLGICFGAQCLSAALGGRVRRSARPERGWIEVHSSDPATVAPGPWLAWHEDEILPPVGARVVARNASGVQAFRYGRHLGVQFHPEATSEIVQRWGEGRGGLDAPPERATAAAAAASRLFATFLGTPAPGSG